MRAEALDITEESIVKSPEPYTIEIEYSSPPKELAKPEESKNSGKQPKAKGRSRFFKK